MTKTTTDHELGIKKAYLSVWLRWAKIVSETYAWILWGTFMGYVMFLICPVTDISALKVYMLEYEMFRIIQIVKKK